MLPPYSAGGINFVHNTRPTMPVINKTRLRHNRPARKAATWSQSLRRHVYDSRRWRAMRDYKLATDPLCEICKAEGRVTLAVDVHHVLPIGEAATRDEALRRAYDTSNLQSLCKECHGRLHATGTRGGEADERDDQEE